MTTRSIVLAWLGVFGLVGCFDEDPIATPTSDGNSTMAQPSTGDTGRTTMSTGSMTTPDDTTGSLSSSSTIPEPTTSGTTSALTNTDPTGPSDTTGCVPGCDEIACGMEDVCGTICGECGMMAECAVDQTYCALPVGHYSHFGDTYPANGGVQFGHRFETFQPRTVRQLGLWAGGAGAQVRIALYSHDGSGPADRIVQTAEVMLTGVGHNVFNVGATDIPAGEYWVMLHTNGMTPIGRTFNGDNKYELALRSVPFSAGFPAVMGDEMIITEYHYNLFMVVEE